jgi:DNA-binding Lrp family transcriptional regulator
LRRTTHMTIYLEDYKTFDNVQEMDFHIKQHATAYYYQMNDTDRFLLSCIARYACKYPGASHLKVETISKEVKRSDATVRRTLRKLEELQIIKKVSTIRRVSKGYGANIITILPYDDKSQMTAREEAEKPIPVSLEAPISQNETDNLISDNKELLRNTYSDEKVDTNNSVDNFSMEKKASLYNRFKSTIVSVLGQDQQMVSNLYGVFRSITYRTTKAFPQFKELYEDMGYKALIVSLQAIKRKKIRNILGYFAGIFDKIYQRDLFEFFQDNE